MSPAARAFWTWWVIMTFSALVLAALEQLSKQGVPRRRRLDMSVRFTRNFQGWMIIVLFGIVIWWIWS